MGEHAVEVREPREEPRRVAITGEVEVGRECSGIDVADAETSRRHLRLAVHEGELVVEDLGSMNGTWVNGTRIQGSVRLVPGDVVRLGQVEIEVLGDPEQDPRSTVPLSVPEGAPTAGESDGASRDRAAPSAGDAAVPGASVRPAVEELVGRDAGAVVIRFRPGSHGERAAPSMAKACAVARRRLAGLGSEPWGVVPQVCLVDPFPDPEHPGEVVAQGAVVDARRGEIWIVSNPESPAEVPERILALFFGASLPAADELASLLEGYGLHLADAPDPDPQLRQLELPPMAAAEGDVATAMGLSFVRWLLERGGADDFLRFLATAQPGAVDAAARQVYGTGLTALEEAWRQQLLTGAPDVSTGQFARLALRYLRPHWRRQAEIAVYMLAALAFTMAFPFVIRRLIDDAIPGGRFSSVLALLTALAVALAVSLVAGLRRAYLSAWVSGSVVRQVRSEMFARLQALDMGWFGRHQQGDVLSRLFNDVGVLEAGVSDTLRDGAFQALSLAVAAVVLLLLDPLLGVIVLLAAPIVALVYRSMASEARRRSIAVQEQGGVVLSVAAENYGAQPVVKAFALEARERARFGQASDRLFDREVRLQLFGGLFGLSVNLVVSLLRMLVLGLGAWLIIQDRLTIGGLVAFIGVMGEALNPVTALTGIGQQVQAASGALVRINEVLDATPAVDDTADAQDLAPLAREIRLEGVGFSYSPERRVLDGIDVVIPAGSRVAFVGPTGAGKSSVLQLLMRFSDPDEGAVRLDGTDIRDVTLASLRRQLGVVFQDTFLFDTTIRDNIALGNPNATDAEVESAARAAELHDFVAGLPSGYDTVVGERGGRLSGGQRQRLAIARALLRDPRILLLDEATSALDPRTERLIADTLERVGEGRTTVAVTHRLTSIVAYDRIFVIVEGRLIEQGTHDELVALGGTYAGLWAEQTGAALPAEAPFDAVTALARTPMFAGVSREEVAAAAERLRAVRLGPGDSLPEGGGRLVLVRSGRCRLVSPDLAGELAVSAELGPGDTFGLAALLGQETGSVLEAVDPVVVLVLDGDALAALAAASPAVAAALSGQTGVPAPAGGHRLSRLTYGAPARRPTGAPVADLPIDAPAASAGDVRRASGSFTGLDR